MIRWSLLSLALVALLCAPSVASITIPGADGSDGVFNPTSNVEIDLGQAATAAWDTASPVPGKGVYDGQKWAVVFKYSEVNIPAGVTVTFKNHVPNAPVVWLVSGNVTIDGTVDVSGKRPIGGGRLAAPGPGGFRGGSSYPGGMFSNGFGPGGGIVDVSSMHDSYSAGAFATVGYQTGTHANPQTYGSPSLIALVGGSGASGGEFGGDWWDGGSGGGAILVACTNQLAIGGAVRAQGTMATRSDGYYGAGNAGSGGGIRLIADAYSVLPSGTVCAQGGDNVIRGGDGRIRIEAAHGSISGSVLPEASYGAPASPAQIWPTAGTPSVKVTQVAGVSASADPAAGFEFPNQDVSVTAEQTVTIRVETANVPLDWTVKVRVGPRTGQAVWVTANHVSGDETASVWEATQVTLSKGFTAIQARASKP